MLAPTSLLQFWIFQVKGLVEPKEPQHLDAVELTNISTDRFLCSFATTSLLISGVRLKIQLDSD
jgi:hypothetical protein